MRRSLFIVASAAALAAGAVLTAQQGAPSEGQVQTGTRLVIERDIEFARAGQQALRLDLYRPDPTPTPNPVVVWIHGADAPFNVRSLTPASALVTPGYAVASIDYRTGAGATLAGQVADAKAAVRWVRANAGTRNLDPERIAVMGHGAGGQIAAIVGTSAGVAALESELGPGPSTRVSAAVVLAAPVGGGSMNSLTHVSKDAPPTWIVHGTADTKVSTWESQKLVSALKIAGATATLDLQIGAGHDIGSLLSVDAMQSITTFLNQQLRGARQGRTGTRGYLAAPLSEWVDPVPLDLGGTLFKTYPTPVRGPGTFAGYRIYLPPDYATNTTRRYPVIYFLHGSGQDAKRPITSGYIARVDAAIRSGVMPPTIVVAASAPNRNRWMDSFDGKVPIESVLWKNLLPHIDATYRTIATREGRAIEGHSMGGFGALRNGFNNPDIFAAVTGNSSGPSLEIPEGPPEPGNIDVLKEIHGGDRESFIAQAPITIAARNAAKLRDRHIRLICGTEDPAFERVKLFHEALVKLDIPHEFIPVPRSPHNHDQLLEYQTFDTMAFYGKVFRNVSASR
jgi:endo-1,4-beta-xylanase